jgi:hypothetical protein
MQTNQFKEVCRHLRAVAPIEWKEFFDAFAEYTAEAVDAVTEADADRILEAKGFARACKALQHTFQNLDPKQPTLATPLPPTPYAP